MGSNSYSKTCSIPSSVKPSCSISVSDPTGYLSTYGGFVKSKSKFQVTVNATTSYGSAISSYSTTANGSTYTSASFTTDVLKSSGTLTISAKVTDKRGRSGTASVSKTVLNYTAPAITRISVTRCDSNGTANDQGSYAKVTFNSSVTSLSNKNSATYVLKYKKTSASSYSSVTLSNYTGNYAVSGGSYVFSAETGSSYNVTIQVTDNFGSGSQSTTVSTAATIMHWKSNGKGMGIGKVAETDNTLEIAWNTNISGYLRALKGVSLKQYEGGAIEYGLRANNYGKEMVLGDVA